MNPAPLGQHFLTNRAVALKIVRQLLPARGPILEIGPGRGILTDLLVREARGSRLVLVEMDQKLMGNLVEQYGRDCRILGGDILDVRLETLAGGEKVNLIGNIPYYISSPLIDWTIDQFRFIRRGILMMQREFVAKTITPPGTGEVTARGLMFRFLFETEKILDVRPGSFSPPPRVTSTVFAFFPRHGKKSFPDPVEFYTFLRRAFHSPRKTLLNNLSPVYGGKKTTAALDILKVDRRSRAQQLGIHDFLRLFEKLF